MAQNNFTIYHDFMAQDPDYGQPLHEAFVQVVNDIANEYGYLFPKLFGAGIEIADAKGIYFRSIVGSGYYINAEINSDKSFTSDPDILTVKLDTLKRFPELGISGFSTMSELVEHMAKALDHSTLQQVLNPDMRRVANEFPSAAPGSILSKEAIATLHQHYITFWKGAITVPMQMIHTDVKRPFEDQAKNCYIRTGFTGSKQEIDLDMAVLLLRYMQAFLAQYQKHVIYNYNYDILWEKPEVRYRLDNLNVKQSILEKLFVA